MVAHPRTKLLLITLSVLLVIAMAAPTASAQTAAGFNTPPPNTVQTTLEGCRNNGGLTLTGPLPLLCPDANYTTGNLGKGWAELDLVPYRLTVKNGNSTGPVTYNIIVAGDYQQGASAIGYDVITPAVKNGTLSNSSSCSVNDASSGQQTVTGVTGGTDTTIYRTLQISQPANTTCVFDYDMRLALGSHLFPGSSLQGYKFESADFSLGKATISIPVNEIAPQELSKTMTATQGSDNVWTISKNAPASLTFPNVCDPTQPQTKPVTIQVTWTKQAVPGGITITTTVTATNPASRDITVNVTDKIYLGTTQTNLLDTAPSGPVNVPANTTLTVLTHTYTDTVNTSSTSYNDVATATYVDTLTGIPIPQTTTATASATVTQNSGTNGSATITDQEDIAGTNFKFSLDSFTPNIGSVTNPSGYNLGVDLVTSLTWATPTNSITGNGSVSFTKSINNGGSVPGTATLTDLATLVGSDGFTTDSGTQTLGVSAAAIVSLTIQKTINPSATQTFTFHVFNSANLEVATPTIAFSAGGATTLSAAVNNLQPDTYTVTEDPVTGWITDGTVHTVDLTAISAATCSATTSFTNTEKAQIIVKKVTNPNPDPTNSSFAFTAGGGLSPTSFSLHNGGMETFSGLTPQAGYTVTETTPNDGKKGWAMTNLDCLSASGGSSKVISGATATINLAAGDTVTCTYTNATGRAQVTKTFNGGPIPSGTSFTFQLREGASTSAAGTILESETFTSLTPGGSILFSTLLIPGHTYEMCEQMQPGWLTTLGPPLYSVFNPSGDNSVVCTNFTATAGQTIQFTINNQPPPGGMALTIGFWKNWASCSGSNGKQKPILDQTLASFPGGGVYVGDLLVNSCAIAVDVLNKATANGTKKASNPAYNLAAQLLAAELNVQAGAGVSTCALQDINAANALLTAVKFAAAFTGNTVPTMSASQQSKANSLATQLNNYNNNLPVSCVSYP